MTTNTETHQEIIDVLKKHEIIQLNTIDEIQALFNIESVKLKDPIIHTEHNTIILFDNPDYNVAYLHEMINSLLNNKENIADILDFPEGIPENLKIELIVKLQQKFNIIQPTIKLYYCNVRSINEELFKPFFKNMFDNIQKQNESIGGGMIQPNFDYDCPPIILMLNKDVNSIFLDFEKFMPFSIQNIFGAFITIHDAYQIEIQESMRQKAISDETQKESIDKFGSQEIPEKPKFQA